MLPGVVLRDLEKDPNQTTIEALRLLQYERAKQIYDSADAKLISKGGELVEMVQENDFALAHEALEAAQKGLG